MPRWSLIHWFSLLGASECFAVELTLIGLRGGIYLDLQRTLTLVADEARLSTLAGRPSGEAWPPCSPVPSIRRRRPPQGEPKAVSSISPPETRRDFLGGIAAVQLLAGTKVVPTTVTR